MDGIRGEVVLSFRPKPGTLAWAEEDRASTDRPGDINWSVNGFLDCCLVEILGLRETWLSGS